MWIAAGYVGLLTASSIVRSRAPIEPVLGPDDAIVVLRAVDGGHRTSHRVRVVYSDLRPAVVPRESDPIVLLHGSPGTKRDFDRMGPELARAMQALLD